MKLYKTYNCVAVTFLVAVSGFMCVLMLSTDPQGAESAPTDSWTLSIPAINPTLTDELQSAQADEAEIQTLNDPFASNAMDLQEQDLSAGDSPIEFNADNSGDSANLASAIEVNGGSDTGVVASNYSGYPSSSGASSSPYSGGNTAGGSSGDGALIDTGSGTGSG